MASAKAEEGQDRQNHNNQADKIDKTVHGFLPAPATIFLSDNFPKPAKFLAPTGKVATVEERDGHLMPYVL
ncbi:hypothetical protein [Bradyrhizobium sp. AUGA SZCCT0283]|uniref:hypothetical protein n=1 Tax=Bradyrhizobium sp. AUGA SZCCT0283 TaxID=2807671 RepID=UPI001BA88979|nr:hypothetical protein [Bradyrhizobium sp. AUGA SZCCT0283]MBR1279014.1 hypothetical protein [Bradyrhizobium sp. AUGA SZCCT0283]